MLGLLLCVLVFALVFGLVALIEASRPGRLTRRGEHLAGADVNDDAPPLALRRKLNEQTASEKDGQAQPSRVCHTLAEYPAAHADAHQREPTHVRS